MTKEMAEALAEAVVSAMHCTYHAAAYKGRRDGKEEWAVKTGRSDWCRVVEVNYLYTPTAVLKWVCKRVQKDELRAYYLGG